MAEEITLIRCDCGKGELEIIGQTNPNAEGSLCRKKSTYFLKCIGGGCDNIFYADAGEADCACKVELIKPYKGRLEEDEIRAYVSHLPGRYDPDIDYFPAEVKDIEELLAGTLTYRAQTDNSGKNIVNGVPEVFNGLLLLMAPAERIFFEKAVLNLRELVIISVATGKAVNFSEKIDEVVTEYTKLPSLLKPWARKTGEIISEEIDGDEANELNRQLKFWAESLSKKLDHISYI